MHFLPYTLLTTACAVASANAYSFHSARALADLQRHSAHSPRSNVLLGDLARNPGNFSPSGAAISGVLTGASPATADPTDYKPPGAPGSPQCSQDLCCSVGYMVADTLRPAFTSPQGCTALARGAIRLGFHDAAAWNSSLPTGGADGSLVLNAQEAARSDNRGLEEIIAQTRTWYDQYKGTGISMADLIQVSAITAVAACPGGPRIKTFLGRKDSTNLPPEGLLPSATADAQTNIALFEAKTFSAADLVALVGAHTVSTQSTVDPSKPDASQDTTPATWDTLYYGQTADPSTPPGVVKFPSDVSLASSPATSGTWKEFETNLGGWNAVSTQKEEEASIVRL